MTKLTKRINGVVGESSVGALAEARFLAELSYDPRDPFAVTITFATKTAPTWRFSRGLLTEGIAGVRTVPVGAGDVRVRRETELMADGLRDEVRIELFSPSGSACLWFPTAALHQFLDATYHVVPDGSESSRIEWDAELRTLIGDLA